MDLVSYSFFCVISLGNEVGEVNIGIAVQLELLPPASDDASSGFGLTPRPSLLVCHRFIPLPLPLLITLLFSLMRLPEL